MIEVKECSKAFGTVKAVNKATLDVGVREVFGLVGSNCFSISQMTVIFRQIIQQWIWCAFTGTSILSFEPGFFMN